MMAAKIVLVVAMLFCLQLSIAQRYIAVPHLDLKSLIPKSTTHTHLGGHDISVCTNASCRDLCGHTDSTGYGNCFCDTVCLQHGDCCLDYEAVCLRRLETSAETPHFANATMLRARLEHQPQTWSQRLCVEVPTHDHGILHVLMHTQCPSESDDIDLVEKCEGVWPEQQQQQGLVFRTPVQVGELYYRNIYCALCHGAVSDIQEVPSTAYLEANFECAELHSEALSVLGDMPYQSFIDFSLSHCRLFFTARFVPMIKTHHGCGPVTCDPDLQGQIPDYHSLDQMCRSYSSQVYAPVHQGHHLVYKNPHCALCSGVDSASILSCQITPATDPMGTDTPPSFKVLLDFSGDSSDFGVTVKDTLLCPAGSKHDMLEKTCYPLPCDEGVYFGRECISFNDTVPQLDLVNRTTKYSILSKWHLHDISTAKFFTDVFEPVKAEMISFLQGFQPIISEVLQRVVFGCEVEWSSAVELLVEASAGAANASTVEDILSHCTSNQSYIQHRCALILIDVHFELPAEFLQWLKEKASTFQEAFESLVSMTEDSASFVGAVMVDFDAYQTELQCAEGGVLMARDDVVFVLSNEAVMADSEDASLVVNATGLTYTTDSVGIGSQVSVVGSHMNQTHFALVCEASILHCPAVVVTSTKNSINTTNGTLIISGDETTIEVGPAFFMQLSSSAYAICEEILNQEEDEDWQDLLQGILTLVGNSLSILGLAWTLLTYSLFRSLRTVPGKSLMNLALSLALAQLLFQIGPALHHNALMCSIIGALDHYLFLVAFATMSVLAYDSSQVFSRDLVIPQHSTCPSRLFCLYMMFSWGAPLIIVLVCVCLTIWTDLPISYNTGPTCWIGGSAALLVAFAIPIGLLLLVNMVLFILTTTALRKTMQIAQVAKGKDQSSSNTVIYVKLSSIMGFTWIFGFLSNISSLHFLVYPFIVFSTLQGVFVCLAFACTTRVLKMWRRSLFLMSHSSKGSNSDLKRSSTTSTTKV